MPWQCTVAQSFYCGITYTLFLFDFDCLLGLDSPASIWYDWIIFSCTFFAMLYANLLMFCSRSAASQCCSLQSLSFTGFLKGYFIACHYHSLWLYGLCSVLGRRSLPAAAPAPLFCPAQVCCGPFCLPALQSASDIPPFPWGRWDSVISALWFIGNGFFPPKYCCVSVKYRMCNALCWGSFDTSQAAFNDANVHWKEMPMFHPNDIIKLIIIY